MLTFEMPLIRLRITNQVEFAEPRELKQSKRITPMARCLALGYRIVQAVDPGELDGYREVARRMGVSHTRVSVLVALTQLSPRIQEAILLGADEQLGFASLLKIARTEGWKAQEAMAETEIRRQRLWGANSRIGDLEGEPREVSRPNSSQRGRSHGRKNAEGQDRPGMEEADRSPGDRVSA